MKDFLEEEEEEKQTENDLKQPRNIFAYVVEQDKDDPNFTQITSLSEVQYYRTSYHSDEMKNNLLFEVINFYSLLDDEFCKYFCCEAALKTDGYEVGKVKKKRVIPSHLNRKVC